MCTLSGVAWQWLDSFWSALEACAAVTALHARCAVLSSTVAPVQEAKIMLVRLFQRYTFGLKPGQEPLELRNTITLSPKNGVIVKPIPHKSARMEE